MIFSDRRVVKDRAAEIVPARQQRRRRTENHPHPARLERRKVPPLSTMFLDRTQHLANSRAANHQTRMATRLTRRTQYEGFGGDCTESAVLTILPRRYLVTW